MLVLLLAVSLAAGCAAPIVEGAHEAHDYSLRSGLEAKAKAGDAKAQYELGDTYCCTVTKAGTTAASVYDNQKATYWLCQSAQQGYGPAQYKLAKIYSGDLVDGVRLMKRAAMMVSKPDTDPALALMWARLAVAHNVDGAEDLLTELEKDASADTLIGADKLMRSWKVAPCQWNDVFTQ